MMYEVEIDHILAEKYRPLWTPPSSLSDLLLSIKEGRFLLYFIGGIFEIKTLQYTLAYIETFSDIFESYIV